MDYTVRNDATDVVRIGGAPPDTEWMLSYGLEPEYEAKDGWEGLSAILARKDVLSRYATGAAGVYYTSVEFETALAERGHVVANYVFGKPSTPDVHETIELRLSISGRHVDLTEPVNLEPALVHPREYKRCQAIGSWCSLNDMDFLKAPSARKNGGRNAPVFRKNAVDAFHGADRTQFVQRGPEIVYQRDGEEHVPQIDDVYPDWRPKS